MLFRKPCQDKFALKINLTACQIKSKVLAMELKQLLKDIKSTGITDQALADMLSIDGDKVNQCLIYKWREDGVMQNELMIKRYKKLVEIHKSFKRRKKIK